VEEQLRGQQVAGKAVAAVWRIENPSLWKQYAAAREMVITELARLQQSGASAVMRAMRAASTNDGLRCQQFQRKVQEEALNKEANEQFLLHGTKPESLETILTNGPSEKFSAGLFGEGVYLADNPCKNDQYATVDAGPTRALGELHCKLYRTIEHPGKVYYLLLCRVVLGYAARTKDGSTTSDASQGIWAKQNKELACITGTNIHHHSLIAETGGVLKRHREYMQFHATRIYPAYLIAYHRKLNGQRM